MMQSAFQYPASLTEKYRPMRVSEFAGLDKPKRVFGNFVARPTSTNFLFVGPSGTGKTSFAQAVAMELNAEVHEVGSQETNLETLKYLTRICQYVPLRGGFHVLIFNEADGMTNAAQEYLLSRMDSSAPLPNAILIFTCNSTEKFEARFLSRCKVLEFSSHGLSAPLVALLEKVWHAEGGNGDCPNLARMVKESNNNARESLQRLEIALLDR